MKPSILALTAGTIASALFACAQPPVLPPPQIIGVSTNRACDALTQPGAKLTGSDFVRDKVRFLSASYKPQLGAAPSASDIGTAVDPNSPYGQDLAAAFDMAPDFFQNSLCNLTQVFIIQCAQEKCTPEDAIDNSWGLREWPRGMGKYIATSAALWQDGRSAIPFSKYRNKRLQLLLTKISNSNLANWTNFPTYSPANNDTGAMTILSALAHEMGHVLWYEAFVPVRGQDIKLSHFCGGFYKPNAWNAIDIPPGRWISFGQQNGNIVHNPDYISVIKGDLQPEPTRQGPDFAAAGEHLNTLLQDQGFASTLAAVSPDEEFVETYQLFVLLRSGHLRDFKLTIYGRPSSVPGVLNEYVHNIPIDQEQI
jgi:hypothetical protein